MAPWVPADSSKLKANKKMRSVGLPAAASPSTATDRVKFVNSLAHNNYRIKLCIWYDLRLAILRHYPLILGLKISPAWIDSLPALP